MDKTFQPANFEGKIYEFWEKNGFFEAKVDKKKKPFTIILPPPNANGSLHLGHAMFVYEDIMIRHNKLLGHEVLWLPGTDHAGIETQYVFEKQLRKQDKSRFDFDRETLYKMIQDFVAQSKGTIQGQLRRLGFALDWKKEKYTMDSDVRAIVYETFKKLFDQGYVYRDYKLVNYCTRCGTSFSDLEVEYVEQKDSMYYMKYGPFVIATVRPETKFRDTALAVNPKDKRYKKWLGKSLEIQGLLGPIKMTMIADDEVDPKFGTGIMKVTPAHDMHDFDLGKKYNLPVTPIIDFRGRMDFSWFLNQKGIDPKYMERAQNYHEKKVLIARALMVEDLKKDGILVKVDENYTHRVGKCYKCGTIIEPLPLKQWFIKIKPLADAAKKLISGGKIKLYPSRYKKVLNQILDNFIDWNLSRQIVWGVRIPAYRCKSKIKSLKSKEWFVSVVTPTKCQICGECKFEQDPDTFDTWFSSAQWPFATLMTQGSGYYDNFYPTSVMETGHDILRAWVARMIMIGYFVTKKPPFESVYLHGMVRDRQGQKMSKSKGNVIDVLQMVDKYGADAFRASLVFGIKTGGDVSLSDEKIIGMRNFANKIWNIGRFLILNSKSQISNPKKIQNPKSKIIKELKKEFEEEKKKYLKSMDKFQFSQALGDIYEFIWHRFADFYIEKLKDDVIAGKIEVLDELKEVYFENLKMLHPYMPFVTEVVWKVFHGEEESILNEKLKVNVILNEVKDPSRMRVSQTS